jgi:hypothetical protein
MAMDTYIIYESLVTLVLLQSPDQLQLRQFLG